MDDCANVATTTSEDRKLPGGEHRTPASDEQHRTGHRLLITQPNTNHNHTLFLSPLIETSPSDIPPSIAEMSPSNTSRFITELSPSDIPPFAAELSPSNTSPFITQLSPSDIPPFVAELSPSNTSPFITQLSPHDIPPFVAELSPSNTSPFITQLSPHDIPPFVAELSPSNTSPFITQLSSSDIPPFVAELSPSNTSPFITQLSPSDIPPFVAELSPSNTSPFITQLSPSDIPPFVAELRPSGRAQSVTEPNPSDISPSIAELSPNYIPPSITELFPHDIPPPITEVSSPYTPIHTTNPPDIPPYFTELSPPEMSATETNIADLPQSITDFNSTNVPPSSKELSLPEISQSNIEASIAPSTSPHDISLSFTEVSSDVSLSELSQPDISPSLSELSHDRTLSNTESSHDRSMSVTELNHSRQTSITEVSNGRRTPVTELSHSGPMSITEVSHHIQPELSHRNTEISTRNKLPSVMEPCHDRPPSIRELSHHNRPPSVTEMSHDGPPSITRFSHNRLSSNSEVSHNGSLFSELNGPTSVLEMSHDRQQSISELSQDRSPCFADVTHVPFNSLVESDIHISTPVPELHHHDVTHCDSSPYASNHVDRGLFIREDTLSELSHHHTIPNPSSGHTHRTECGRQVSHCDRPQLVEPLCQPDSDRQQYAETRQPDRLHPNPSSSHTDTAESGRQLSHCDRPQLVEAVCQSDSDRQQHADIRQPRPRSEPATSEEWEARSSAQRTRRNGQEAGKVQEQRPTSGAWLRVSMRRVRQLPLPPLATPDTVLDILANNDRRPNSAPGGGPRSRRDFPRRYSSYNAATIHSSSTNLTQAAEPVAVESPSSEEEEEDVSSGSEGTPAESAPHARPGSEPDTETNSPLGSWPHNLSSMLASLGCTLGLFNISRFAILSIHFGANFIIQFLFLTLVMGVPLYTLHACLGQCLGAGVMDMWRISPIFQGIGIALLVSQALIGVYSIVGVSWMFIYFRDSFITKQDQYRWAEPYEPYREVTANTSWRLEETVPDYFSGIVLQRYNLKTPESSFGHVKFQVAFNLAVVWMIVFVSLSKGLRSYGKVVYVFSLFPVFGTLVLCTKMLGLTPTNTTHEVFPQTVWSEFFLNTKCWIAATMEVFFTWGLLGAAAMQIASHNRHKRLLNRDTSLVIVLTLAVLLLAAFLANTCVTILHSHGFTYIPSSFEHMSTYSFLHSSSDPLPPSVASVPVRYMTHTTLIAGNRVTVPGVDSHRQSGYQVLRLATELVPSTLALLGADTVSPFWAVLFYFVLILFGIAQQLCIWHCVITGVMAINATTLKSWETTITFFSCACGFILGLPMTTELGIFVVYFLDYSVGCSWWLMVLYLLEIIAVFVVRGRPYSGETIVATLLSRSAGCLQTWAAPMLVFTWNVILPIALMVLCITSFKNGQFRDLYNWRSLTYDYWPVWTREVGCMLQILPIVIVPLVCIVQSCRYLSDGPPDILDRIQMLYRPSMTRQDIPEEPNSPTNSATSVPAVTVTPAPETTTATNFEDPPPKYTPPPSYTAATGARIAKLLRRSFRRSMRRLTGATSNNSNEESYGSPLRTTLSPPPDYAAVLVEMNQAPQIHDERDSCIAPPSSAQESSSAPTTRSSTLTAADVAQILRSSLRNTVQRRRNVDRLVDAATPIHQDLESQSSSHSKPDAENTSVI